MRDRTAGLSAAAQHARDFLAGLDERPVAARVDAAGVRDALGGPLPEDGEDPEAVIDALVAGAEPGLVATAGPRHFGFVIGGALPAALAADWLVSAWDQNAAFHSLSPAAAAIEEVTVGVDARPARPARRRQRRLRHRRAGREHHLPGRRPPRGTREGRLERRGRRADRRTPGTHTLRRASPRNHLHRPAPARARRPARPSAIAADDQGRMRPDALRDALADRTARRSSVPRRATWPPARSTLSNRSPRRAPTTALGCTSTVRSGCGPPRRRPLRHLTRGVERADSWAVDAHKWLNVPYDSAMAIVADSDAHVAAMSLAGPYLVADPGQRDSTNYVPESSRRARVVPDLRRAEVAGPNRGRRTGRAQLRAGPAHGRATGRDSRRADPQRRRAQPGAGATAGRRRRQPGRGGRGSARRDLLAGRHDVGRQYVLRVSFSNWATTTTTSTARPTR